MARIKIIDSQNRIEQNILKSSRDEIRNIFHSAKPRIEGGIKNLLRSSLQQSAEIQALKSGKLVYDFGLVIDPTDDLIDAIVESTHILFRNFRFNKRSTTNVLSIYIQPSDFDNLLSLAIANVVTERGEVLPWLEWMLTSGDSIVIAGYSVEYGPFPTSRTGGAIMVPFDFFKVDPQFSGTIEDNFITRALNPYGDQISRIIQSAI